MTHGGVLMHSDTLGYTLGNFVYINRTASMRVPAGTIDHETGHVLQVAAFGSIWHFVGAWDENVGPSGGRRSNAYAEQLAEGHNPPGIWGGVWVPLWARMWR